MAIDSFKINRSLSVNPQSSAITNPEDGDLYYQIGKGFSTYKDGFWHDLTDVIDFAASLSMTSINLDDASVRNNMIKLTGVLASQAELHGLAPSAKGKFVYVYNQTNETIILKHQSFTETDPTARIVTTTGRDIKLKPNQASLVSYDTTTNRWLVLSVGGSGGDIEIPFILGEDLAAGTPVYVSQGAVDGVRNAGEIYTLDNTDDNRMGYIGVLSESGTTGQERVVKIIGVSEGLSGMTPGLPVYWDAGAYTQTEPTTPGTWKITVGRAISATEMLINPDLASGATLIEAATSSAVINNNQTVPAPIPSLVIDSSKYKSFSAEYWVDRKTDDSIGNLFAPFEAQEGAEAFKGAPRSIAVQSDGKVIVGGDFADYGGVSGRTNLVRFNTNGSVDTSFCINAVDGNKLLSGVVFAVASQPDGKVLVGGDFFEYNGVSGRSYLVRLNADGTLDTAFCANAVDGGKFTSTVYSIAVQSDGKILVGGAFNNYDNPAAGRNKLIRLNADGTFDSAFTSAASGGGFFSHPVYSIAVQPDGKILVGGAFINHSGVTGRNRLIRLNSGGTVDTAFTANSSDGGKFNNNVYSIAIQSDGKILVGGEFTNYGGVSGRNALIRLDSDGSLDVAFCINASDLSRFGAPATSLSVQPDGKIIVGGYFTAYNLVSTRDYLVRLNPDGTSDNSFCINAVDGAKFILQTYCVLALPSGKILVGGLFLDYSSVNHASRLVSLNSDGTLDADFVYLATINGRFSAPLYNVKIDSADKIFVAGNFTNYIPATPGTSYFGKLNADGTPDAVFGLQILNKFNDAATAIGLQTDNKILVGGYFTDYGGTAGRNSLIRLNSTGTLDTAFCTNASDGGKFSNAGLLPVAINCISLQTDGKILVTGAFSYTSSSINHLIRLNADGTADSAFIANAVTGKFSSITPVYWATIQTDGKILVGGAFNDYGGVSGRNKLIRLNTDGTIDTAFTANASVSAKFNGTVNHISVQSDGKIIVAGDFTSYAGTAGRNYLIRLNADGTLDTSFCSNSSDGGKFSIGLAGTKVQSDGKIIVYGNFVDYGGTVGRNRMIRLNADGTLDTSFCEGISDSNRISSAVYSVDISSDDKLIAVGDFVYDSRSANSYIAYFDPDSIGEQKVEAGVIRGVYKSSTNNWLLSIGGIAGFAGISFQITSAGQVTYTTDAMTGLGYSGEMKFNFTNLIEV